MANVVLLMSDEHTPAWSSFRCPDWVRTPNMERLATRGTLFENAYCPSPLCLPSRTAFTTGLRVHQTRAYSNCLVGLPADLPTYPRQLAAAGVHTSYIGCNCDLHQPVETIGFSEFFAERLRKFPGDTSIGRQRRELPGAGQRADDLGPRPEQEGFGRDLLVMEKSLEWLRDTAPTLDRTWVLSINLHAPHFPYHPTLEWWEEAGWPGDLPQPDSDSATAAHPRARELRRFYDTDSFSARQSRMLRKGYLGCVEWVDTQLGRLLDTLAALGMEEDTVVLYTSDHGVMLGEHGLWWKGSLHEGAVRVPCLAAGPGFDGGKSVQTPVDLHDLHATFFKATSTPLPEGRLGCPLQEISSHDDRRVVFSEYHGHGVSGSSFMVRQGAWKFLYHADAPAQLFDVETDPTETFNRIDIEVEKARQMESLLREICDPDMEDQRATEFIEGQLRFLADQKHSR